MKVSVVVWPLLLDPGATRQESEIQKSNDLSKALAMEVRCFWLQHTTFHKKCEFQVVFIIDEFSIKRDDVVQPAVESHSLQTVCFPGESNSLNRYRQKEHRSYTIDN